MPGTPTQDPSNGNKPFTVNVGVPAGEVMDDRNGGASTDIRGKSYPAPLKPRSGRHELSKDDMFAALAQLEEKARVDSDNWVTDFVKSIRLRVLDNKGLSKRQRGKLTEKCVFYKIPLPSLV